MGWRLIDDLPDHMHPVVVISNIGRPYIGEKTVTGDIFIRGAKLGLGETAKFWIKKPY